MSIAGILGAIAAIGSVATAIVYMLKIFIKSSAQEDAGIDKDISQERQKAEETGRPE
jgi:hypothetical protein